MYDEQGRTKKAKDKQSQERIDSGMNSVRWQNVCVSLHQWNDIPVIDIFNEKEVLQSSMPCFRLILYAVVNYIFEWYRNIYLVIEK